MYIYEMTVSLSYAYLCFPGILMLKVGVKREITVFLILYVLEKPGQLVFFNQTRSELFFSFPV